MRANWVAAMLHASMVHHYLVPDALVHEAMVHAPGVMLWVPFGHSINRLQRAALGPKQH